MENELEFIEKSLKDEIKKHKEIEINLKKAASTLLHVSAELEQRETRYRQMYEKSPIPMLREDFSKIKQLFKSLQNNGVFDFQEYFNSHPQEVLRCISLIQPIHINSAFSTLFEISQEDELLGINLIFGEKSYDTFKQLLICLSLGESIFESNLILYTSNNKLKYCRMNVRVDDLETFSIVIITIVDQTSDYHLKQTLKELERSNRELGLFANIASHDLSEPLRTITSYLLLIKQRLGNVLDEGIKELIDFPIDAAKRLNMRINDLLTYSRITIHGKPFEQVHCQEIYEKTLLNLRKLIEENKVEISSDPLPTVIGDSSQLEQLFQNLISNAIKFRTETEIPRIQISVNKSKTEWLFSIRDNGIGITPDDLERIFVLFIRGQSSQKYQGSGIGLAICKKIIERHNGKIWVISEINNGSIFHFTIPIMPVN